MNGIDGWVVGLVVVLCAFACVEAAMVGSATGPAV